MKYLSYLFSGSFMGVLLIAFATAIGYATFVENDYDATTARMVVYNAWWFEALMVLMVVNFSGMIFTKKLYRKQKLNILVIHLALVVILIGAAVTRYVSFEGQMHIRNGETSSLFASSDDYLQLVLEKNGRRAELSEKIMLSPKFDELYHEMIDFEGQPFEVSVVKYIPNAVQDIVQVNEGIPFIKLVIGSPDGRHETWLKYGDQRQLNGTTISFGDAFQYTAFPNYVSIYLQNGQLMIRASDSLTTSPMDGSVSQRFASDTPFPATLMNVHTMGNLPFVITEFMENGYLRYVPSSDERNQGMPIVSVELNNQLFQIPKGLSQSYEIGDVKATITLGSKALELPFALKLGKFEIERYPGSHSPSSYASYVSVIDQERNEEFDYKIYMNHILNYRGYRFFQSSYDQDEQGTILSVNHDLWGTGITYLGYALLFGSLIVSFFTRKTRFSLLTRQLKRIHEQREKLSATMVLFILALVFGGRLQAQSYVGDYVKQEHAAAFGKLLTQDREGRIEPVNTTATKILMKIYKKTTYKGLSADQVFLGIVSEPARWQEEPIIKVGDPALRSILGMMEDYARFSDFLDENGMYKIKDYVDQAHMKKPAFRSTFDKEIIHVDERANVLYMVLNGNYLNIFPIPEDPNNTWATPSEFHQIMGHGTARGDLFENYQKALSDAKVTGDYSQAASHLKAISDYQQETGANIMPSEAKISLELFYNKAKIFQRLFPFYLLVGLVMVGLFFLHTFYPKQHAQMLSKILAVLLLLAFLVHTYGLGLRWYLSGHAPWSNGYESMIYISWATMLAGFLFMNSSKMTLGVTAVLAGITLLTAHMSWMNPEITNLVPVLKSYWLTIHVATITASYGFLGLGCLMGFLNLVLMSLRKNENKKRLNLMLRELTIIVELSLIVGLILLIIGNFLGGIWANESWGRYWGWDAKESWTLVSVIVYSFVLHLRLIPALKNNLVFNILSVLSFGCILMTYFGVNFYLSGLHSYANGDPVPIPDFVYYTLAVIVLVAVLAGINERSLRQSESIVADPVKT